MSVTRTHTYVWVHAWAETEVLARNERPGMTGMPREGDVCSVPGCHEQLRAGERAVAVVEVPREQAAVPERTQAWCGYRHPTHRTWTEREQP